ncbi:MAG: hypothetical protein ACXWV0_01980 [Flavisolibacter sp.]
MKRKITWLLILFFSIAIQYQLSAQSPYLSIDASMDADELDGAEYRMVGSFCLPVQPSVTKTVYGKDTSSISFKSLERHMIRCGQVFETNDPDLPFNKFKYGNQQSGYEKIIVIRVIKLNAGMQASMQIIVPVPYQSFLTFIKIRDIIFLPGKTIWIDLPDTRVKGNLNVNITMKEFSYTEHKFPG